MELNKGHHGPTKDNTVDDKLRLEAQKLLSLAASLCSCLDAAAIARWAKLDEWQPFLKDAHEFMMSMDKLGNGKMAATNRQRAAHEREGPVREPEDPSFLQVRVVPRGTPKSHPQRYAALEARLDKAECYAAIQVTDGDIGITKLTQNPSIAFARRAY